MARLIHDGIRLPHRERGFAMIAIISLIVLISAYLIANMLSRTSADLSIERERRSTDALRQAKAALIAYAASTEGWQTYKGQTTNQPGGLPCPDISDLNGTSPGLCSGASSRVGRLPWATIGADDLRDASGEQLWYAVSSNFRKLSTNVINSDTQGLLSVTGSAPVSNVVAIVFAPGTPVLGQNRTTGQFDVTQYLESCTNCTSGLSYDTFTTSALPSDTFNDRLVVITQADLMSVVEPAVSARIQRDITPYLQTYYSQWGGFPFPAAFANPSPGDNSNAP